MGSIDRLVATRRRLRVVIAAALWAAVGTAGAPVAFGKDVAPPARQSPAPQSPGYQAPDQQYTSAIPPYGGGPSRRSTRVTGSLQRHFDADLEDDRGTMSLYRGLAEVEVTVPVRPRWDARFGGQIEGNSYDLSDPDAIVPGPGRLLEEAYSVRLGVGFDTRIGETWGLAGGVFGAVSAVPDADFGDALTYGVTIVGRHRFGPKFGLRLGATIQSQLEDSVLIIPVIGFDGGSEDGPVRFGVRGNGVRAAYAFTPRFTAGLTVRYESRDWRLAEDDRVSEGVFRDIRVPVGVDAQFDVLRCFSVGVEVGVNVYQEVNVFDDDGDRLTAFEADPSMYLALNLTWVF
jgi:hypothetical protein